MSLDMRRERKRERKWGPRSEGDGKGNFAVSAQMAIGRQEGTPVRVSPQKTIIINVYDRRELQIGERARAGPEILTQ